MPDQTAVIGATLIAYVPDADQQIDLGYTLVRFYVASTENGSYSSVGTATLADGTYDYSYNHTTAAATDWFYWVVYGATPGEGVQSEPMPVGPPRCTRLTVREAVGAQLRVMEGPYTLASVTDSDTAVISELIDADRSIYTIASRFCRCVAGTGIGQTRRIRAGSNGYVASTGTINVNRAFSSAWVANDTVELWLSDGEEDISTMVDAAMQDARRALWWEETWYFSTEDSVSDYWTPGCLFSEAQIKRVEYAAGSYPDYPDWRPVGHYELSIDAGQGRMSVFAAGLGQSLMQGGRVCRVVFNRFGDRMDADTDYWAAPLEWAVAEVGIETALRLATGRGATEDRAQWRQAYDVLMRRVLEYRAVYMPSPAARVRTAR